MEDVQRLLDLIAENSDRIPDFAQTEAEDEVLMTIRSVRAGHEVSGHEIDSAIGYLERLR